jgi:hypothetical protein
MSDHDALTAFWGMLDHVPQAPPDDPRWKHWHVRAGDTVEVVVTRRGLAPDVLGEFSVAAADPDHFKLRDGRCFDQRGWLMTSNKKSPLRARKIRS